MTASTKEKFNLFFQNHNITDSEKKEQYRIFVSYNNQMP